VLDSDDDEDATNNASLSVSSKTEADESGWLERRDVKSMMASDLQANISRARVQHKLISKKTTGPKALLVPLATQARFESLIASGLNNTKKEQVVESGLFSPEVTKKSNRAGGSGAVDDDDEKQRAYEVQSRLHRLTEDRKRRADEKKKRSRERPYDEYNLPSDEASLEESAGSTSSGSSDEGTSNTRGAVQDRSGVGGKSTKQKTPIFYGNEEQAISGSDSDSGSDETENSGIDWADTEVYVSHIKSKVSKVLRNCGELSSQLQSTIDKWRGGQANQHRAGSADGSAIDLTEMGLGKSNHSSGMDTVITEAHIQKCCPGLELKPYQLVGINWLRLLHENDVNGVLADDMVAIILDFTEYLTFYSHASFRRVWEKLFKPFLFWLGFGGKTSL
jgi:hypothetical protein